MKEKNKYMNITIRDRKEKYQPSTSFSWQEERQEGKRKNRDRK